MKKLRALLLGLCLFVLMGTPALAYVSGDGLQGFASARVTEVHSTREEILPGTGALTTIQEISAEITDGPQTGEVVRFDNDYIELKKGQKFFIYYFETTNGERIYSVRDVDRRGPLILLTALFAGVVILFGGKQGVRSLLSLIGSFSVIIFVLLPLLINGYSPVLVSIIIGAVILFVAVFFTHGFNKQSLVAFLGTTIAIILTGILAYVSIRIATLSGFFSDDTAFLNISTEGMLNLRGLLLGGIIIGVLGVLDDIAVTQVAVVAELKSAGKHLGEKEVYKKAIRVGREHVSALVNTLVLAYAGVSLPLLMLFSRSESSFMEIINNEIFATEIVRAIVGSIGLIATVPITTALAVWLLRSKEDLKSVHSHTHHH